MKSIEIKGSLRTDLGKKGTRELRKNNGVPCVLYGVNKDENGLPVATHFTVTVDGLRKLLLQLILNSHSTSAHTTEHTMKNTML